MSPRIARRYSVLFLDHRHPNLAARDLAGPYTEAEAVLATRKMAAGAVAALGDNLATGYQTAPLPNATQVFAYSGPGLVSVVLEFIVTEDET